MGMVIRPFSDGVYSYTKMRALTQEGFINKAMAKHGDRYDYSMVSYKNNRTKVSIICKDHGVFTQKTYNHVLGQGCPVCGNIYNPAHQPDCENEFIRKAVLAHGNKYDYSLSAYKKCGVKVKIICPEHGVFEQLPEAHLAGHGCYMCAGKDGDEYYRDTAWFIIKAKALYGDVFDYSKSIYTGFKNTIIITCKIHGDITTRPIHHLRGDGCKTCRFIELSNKKHDGRYAYDKVNLKYFYDTVDILCHKHGYFKQKVSYHLHGYGCQICSSSKKEILINRVLTDTGIQFIREKSFDDMISKRYKFDFYMPDKNMCIEYNGEQHYRPVHHFGGIKKFINRLKMDAIKRWYCFSHNITLLVIPYWENDIEAAIKNNISKN